MARVGVASWAILDVTEEDDYGMLWRSYCRLAGEWGWVGRIYE